MSKMKALIPNLLTAGNLVGGVLAIIFSLTGRLEWAPYCIFISAFLDFFDGFAARLLKVQSEMGKQLDSLADMVTFGVAPGVMVFVLIKNVAATNYLNEVSKENISINGCCASEDFYQDQTFEKGAQFVRLLENEQLSIDLATAVDLNFQINYLAFFALLIPIMSLFRLAKFNLDTRQSESFIGLPTPANTIFFAAIPLILINTSSSGSIVGDFFSLILYSPWFYIFSVPIMSVLLVAELPLFALKFKSFGWKGNEIRYIFLTLAVILLATLWWLAIPLIIILYILLSLIQNLRHKTAAAKTSK